MTETLPIWRNTCTPHRDIREDAVSEALFAVNLSRAIADQGPEDVRFSGWLIGEEVPLPVTAEEVARLVPGEGKVPVRELYQRAMEAYGAERVSEEEASIALELSLELKGEVNEHAVKMALREIQKRVAGLAVEDVKGE